MKKNTIWLIVLLGVLTADPCSAWFWDNWFSDNKGVVTTGVKQDPTDNAKGFSKMPDFSEKNITAEGMVNSSELKGKVLLVNFWATWCDPCRKEIPSLINLQDKYKDQGFSVIGISMDEGGRKVVSKFIKKLEVNYPVFIGNAKMGRSFGGVMGIPVSFLVDREGNLVERLDGYISAKVFSKKLEKLFN